MTLLLDIPLKTSLVPATGSGSAAFTRATSKTFINSSDVAETVTSGNPALHSEKGALIDPASKTNTMLHCMSIGASETIDPLSSAKWISSTTGSNAVTNSFFDTDTNEWVGSNTTLSLDANRLKILTLASGASPYARTLMTTEIGGRYVVSLDYVVDAVVGSLYCYIRDTLGVALVRHNLESTLGTHKFAFTAVETTAYLYISFASGSVAGGHVIVDNVTCYPAGVNSTLTGTGIDGAANSCALLEFVENGATILQTITAAAAAGCTGFDVKLHTGTGPIEITRDNVTWVDITNLINSDTFTTVAIENTSVTNPVVGFRGANGNKIIVDAGRNHLGTELCEPIFTTTAAVTRNAELLTYQTSGNFSDTAGTILATFTPLYPGAWPSGAVVGKAGSGLLISSSNSGAQAADGTNTVSGATGAPANSSIRIGCRWSGSSLEAFSADPLLSVGTAGSYDGSFDLSTIAINPGAAGYIKDVKVYDASLSDAEVKTAWGLLDSQTFLPAFSNLPIYNAGAIIHVEPDPPPVDPEPTPIFATNFVGVTLNETNPYTDGSLALANFEFTGTDSSTGFVLPPTSPPIDTMSIYTGGQFPLGVQALSSMSGYVPGLFPSSNYTGVSNKVTILNGTETIRGVSQNTLKMTLKAPGAINDFNRQMWFAFRRDTVIDMPQNFTVRYEIKVPAMTWSNLYLNYEGVYSLFDIKDSSDYRYFLTIVKNGAGTVGWKLYADRNAINNYGSAQWTPATPTNSRFFTLYNYTTPVPQEEFFTLEYSRTCPYNKDDATNGRFRVRIRTEADGVTEFTTIFDVSASSIAAHNAINGTNYQNRHRSPTTNASTSYIHRIMHGLYGRFQNVDMPYEIAKFRIFDSFDI